MNYSLDTCLSNKSVDQSGQKVSFEVPELPNLLEMT